MRVPHFLSYSLGFVIVACISMMLEAEPTVIATPSIVAESIPSPCISVVSRPGVHNEDAFTNRTELKRPGSAPSSLQTSRVHTKAMSFILLGCFLDHIPYEVHRNTLDGACKV